MDESNDGAPTKYPYVNTKVVLDFLGAAAEIKSGGVTIGITELFRPRSVQERYYKEAEKNQRRKRHGKKPIGLGIMVAARPGNSNHGGGNAFDLKLNYIKKKLTKGSNKGKTVEQMFNKHGFARPPRLRKSDPYHFTYKHMTWNERAEDRKSALRYAKHCLGIK